MHIRTSHLPRSMRLIRYAMTAAFLAIVPTASGADVSICDWPRGEEISEANLNAVNATLRNYVKTFGIDGGQVQCAHDQTIRGIEDQYGLRGCCENCVTTSQLHNACSDIVAGDEENRVNEVHQQFMRLLVRYIQFPRPERDYDLGDLALFAAAQANWKMYQATLCSAEVSQNDSGTMQPTFNSECMVRVSQDRRAYLTDLYQDYFDVPSAKD